MNKNFTEKHPELWKFIKFNITVIITSALDIISYLILLYFVFASLNTEPVPDNAILSLLGIKYKGYLFAYFISTSIGYIAAYLINRKITFHSDINPVYSSVLYFALSVFNILVSSWIGGIFGSVITSKGLTNPVTEIISKFIIINIPTIWTYPVERYIIQIKKKAKHQIVIASDLDGTLLGSDTNISKENLDAIKRLNEKGIKIAVLTGRTFYEIPAELRSCGYIDYFVYSNGAGIDNSNKETFYYNTIEKSTARRIFDILNSYETFIELYSNKTPFVDKEKFSEKYFEYYKIDRDFIPEMYKSRKAISNLSEIIDSDLYNIEMFDVFFRNNDERKECYNRICDEFDNMEITSSMSNNLEIMNKGINKGTGLLRLCRAAGYNLADVIVIGDSKNDITAFNAANKCYAVSNACDEIKAMANKIICSNDENIMCYMEQEL